MAWTYSGDPAASERDALRYRIGDTEPADPLRTDEELDYELAIGGGVTLAAARACDGLMAKFARLCDVSDGDVSVRYGQKAEHYAALAATLRAEAGAAGSPTPIAAPPDPDPPVFAVGMFDNLCT